MAYSILYIELQLNFYGIKLDFIDLTPLILLSDDNDFIYDLDAKMSGIDDM